MANRVKYGLQDCYYAKASVSTTTAGMLIYDSPVRLPGAVSVTLDASGEMSTFRADNIDYWVSSSNNGYTGSLELAEIPDDFRKDVLKEVEDTNKVLVEKADVETAEFALLFRFEGDQEATLHCMYRCKAGRPSVSGQTTEATITPQTSTISLTALPRIDNRVVKSKCLKSASSAQYESWFTTVYEPVF